LKFTIIKKSKILALISIISILVIIKTSIYNVRIDQQVIITQFGNIIGETKTKSGLYFKIPVIQKVNYLPQHIVHEWNSEANIIQTRDKVYLTVEIYGLWKIGDPIKYFQTIRDESNVPDIFDEIFKTSVKDIITSNKFLEIFRDYDNGYENILMLKQERIDEILKLFVLPLKRIGIELLKLEIKGKK
jgi:membrane protease subunit HflC